MVLRRMFLLRSAKFERDHISCLLVILASLPNSSLVLMVSDDTCYIFSFADLFVINLDIRTINESGISHLFLSDILILSPASSNTGT